MEQEKTKVAELQAEALLLPEKARKFVVEDEETLADANGGLLYIRKFRKKIDEMLDPMIKKARDTYQESTALKKKILAPALEAKEYIDKQVGTYILEQRRKQREAEEAELKRLEAMRKAEEEKLEKALEAEDRGDHAEAEKIIEEEDETQLATPIVQPEAPKLEGVYTREGWKYEVMDIDKVPEQYTKRVIDDEAVKKVVNLQKGETKIPGIRVYSTTTTVTRGR